MAAAGQEPAHTAATPNATGSRIENQVTGDAQPAGGAGHGRRHGAAGLFLDPHDRLVGDGVELQVDGAEARENGVESDPHP